MQRRTARARRPDSGRDNRANCVVRTRSAVAYGAPPRGIACMAEPALDPLAIEAVLCRQVVDELLHLWRAVDTVSAFRLVRRTWSRSAEAPTSSVCMADFHVPITRVKSRIARRSARISARATSSEVARVTHALNARQQLACALGITRYQRTLAARVQRTRTKMSRRSNAGAIKPIAHQSETLHPSGSRSVRCAEKARPSAQERSSPRQQSRAPDFPSWLEPQ